MKTTREQLMKYTQLGGPIAFTESDVDYLLADGAEIEMFRYVTTQPNDRLEYLLDDVPALLKGDYTKASFIITCNKALVPPLTMNELAPLSNLINSEPNNREIFWAFLHDDSLPTNALSLTVIIARNGRL